MLLNWYSSCSFFVLFSIELVDVFGVAVGRKRRTVCLLPENLLAQQTKQLRSDVEEFGKMLKAEKKNKKKARNDHRLKNGSLS